MPLYIGQCPRYVTDKRAMQGSLSQMLFYPKCLSRSEIQAIIAVTEPVITADNGTRSAHFSRSLLGSVSPPLSRQRADESHFLNILSVTDRCIPPIVSLINYTESHHVASREEFQSTLRDIIRLYLIHPLLTIATSAPMGIVRSAAVRVCASVLPALPFIDITDQFVQSSLFQNGDNIGGVQTSSVAVSPQLDIFRARHLGSFVRYLVFSIGSSINVWQSSVESHSHSISEPISLELATGYVHARAKVCSESEIGMLVSRIHLLQSLCESEPWFEVVRRAAVEIINYVPEVIYSLQQALEVETHRGFTSQGLEVDSMRLNYTFGLLGLFGCLQNDGFHPGARTLYILSDESNYVEECIILTPTLPPAYESTSNNSSTPKTDPKEVMWKGLTCFGDAYAIMLLSQRGQSLIVPRNRLVLINQSATIAGSQQSSTNSTSQTSGPVAQPSLATPLLSKVLFSFRADHLLLSRFYEVLSRVECIDKRPNLKPNIVEKDDVAVFESSHPYLASTKLKTHIRFPGAKRIKITFHPSTRTASSADYVKFFKDDSKSAVWGEDKYYGKDSEANWPGVNGKAPLVIPSDS